MRIVGTGFGRWVLAATVLGAVVRIAWLINQWNNPIGFEDAFFYHHQANLLADGHGFISPFPFLSSGIASPAAEHPPLYSLYLSVFSFLGATSVGWHQLATTLLGIATVPLIGLAGREAGGERVGVIAAVIAAIYPHLWYQDGIVWAEASAQACVALFVLVAYRYVRRPSLRNLATLGLASALAAMARTELVLLLPLGVIPLALLTQGLPRARRISWAAVAMAVGVAALLPWIAFNLARFDEPTTLSSNLGLTLASANCDSTWYGPTIGYWDFACAQTAGEQAALTGGDPSAVDAQARAEALRYISDNRGRLPAVMAARMGRISGIWSPAQQVRIDVIEHRPKRVAQSGVALWWLVLALALVGVGALRKAKIPSWPAVAPVVVMLIGVATAFASTRYRASAEPAMVVLAAAGAVSLLDRWFARRPGHAAPDVDPERRAPTPAPATVS
ncbi:ArnT family glycosyltransferase [Aquihabitans sp. McL0605]|uniref:ArnT family glycosyltransferase n=1 Tax=Aquihabitans sp. McL0605 TaxID=3415671 RepID=UPI003CEB0422